MAVDQIYLEYRLGLTDLKKDAATIATTMKGVETSTTRSAANATQGVQKLTRELRGAGAEATKVADRTKAGFDKVTPQLKKVGDEVKKTGGAFSFLQSSVTQSFAAIGLSLGIQQVIQFGKASVEAFIDAEKNAQLLLFALNGNEAAQNRLLAQATRLQETTIYDDDTIQQAQTFLATQGRTEEQITKVIDAAVELSSVTGTDVDTAVRQLDATFEGNIGRLAKLDSGFKSLTKEQLANGAAADLLIEKYQGTAVAIGETTAGQVAKLKNQFGELQETIGGEIVPTLLSLFESFESFKSGDLLGGLDRISDVAGAGIPPIQELKEAFEAFANGDFWEGIKNLGETTLSAATLGFYTRVKNYFYPATEDYVEGLTNIEKAAIAVTIADKNQIEVLKQQAIAQGVTTTEFDKFARTVREAAVKEIFDGLSQSLDITNQQFKELLSITDKYGISARVTSDQILQIKDATEDELSAAFKEFHEQLGVNITDWNDYIGKVRQIKPLQDDVAASTKTLPGPYDALSQSVQKAYKSLQDLATLFEQGKIDYSKVTDQAKIYANGQNEIVKINDLVAASLKRIPEAVLLATTSMSTVKVPVAELTQEVEKLKITYADLLAAEKDYNNKTIQSGEELVNRRAALFEQLGFQQQTTYEKNLEELERLKTAEILASDGTLASIQRIIDKYEEAKLVLQAQNIADVSGALAGLAENLNTALSQIFGEAASNSAIFADFQKAITLTTIALKSAEAIASGIAAVAAGASSGDPLKLIGGIASIVAGVGNIIGGIISTVQSTNVPQPPSFNKGTDYVQLNGNPKGIDTIPAYLNEGEGVVTTDANKAYPGLVKAMNLGKAESYMLNFAAPKLKEQSASLADNRAASMLLQKGEAFDDFRLSRIGNRQVSLLEQNNLLLQRNLQKQNRRNIQ